MGGRQFGPCCPVPMPSLWPSASSLFSRRCPTDLAVSSLRWALTRPSTPAQLNFVGGLGEVGHLVVLILHVHTHRLRAPQDTSVLGLQGDLTRRSGQSPTLPRRLPPPPGPAVPVAGTLSVPPGPGPWSPAGSQILDPQQRGPPLPLLYLLTVQSGPQPPHGATAAGGGRTEVKRARGESGGCPFHPIAPFFNMGKLRLREGLHLPEVTKPVRNRMDIQSQSSFPCVGCSLILSALLPEA